MLNSCCTALSFHLFFAKIEENGCIEKIFKPLKINHNLNKKHLIFVKYHPKPLQILTQKFFSNHQKNTCFAKYKTCLQKIKLKIRTDTNSPLTSPYNYIIVKYIQLFFYIRERSTEYEILICKRSAALF